MGFTALIPIFGAFIGVGIGAFDSSGQSHKSPVVYPLLRHSPAAGGQPHLPPGGGQVRGAAGIWVLAAVTVGGNAFGLAGMLLAVPLCSVLYTLARQGVNARLARKGLSS